MHLLGLGIAVKFAEQACTVPASPFAEVGDEGINQIPAGFTEFLSATEISGIALDEIGIELIGDIHALGRGGGAGVVLELDLVREKRTCGDEVA